jgi:hypothetical protein
VQATLNVSEFWDFESLKCVELIEIESLGLNIVKDLVLVVRVYECCF